ncbi:MAG: polyprenyl synthetase family protein [Armatimonadota bacterium]
MNLEAYLTERCALIDSALAAYLPEERFPEVIYQAMRYSVLDGGKRLRPVLVLAGCEAAGGDPSLALPAACALEFIHAFSLIHDDLPALDNDDLRRGKPTNHKVFGEAIAILAGDALLTLAFEISPPSVAREIAQAAGVGGMIGGQVIDMLCEGKEIDAETLALMHAKKTGALIRVSVVAGGKLAGASPDEVSALSTYGEQIGLAFQIADDILDVTGDQEKLGKPVGSDEKRNKSTYPALFGLERSRDLARAAVDEACRALQPFGPRAEPLRAIARFTVDRES